MRRAPIDARSPGTPPISPEGSARPQACPRSLPADQRPSGCSELGAVSAPATRGSNRGGRREHGSVYGGCPARPAYLGPADATSSPWSFAGLGCPRYQHLYGAGHPSARTGQPLSGRRLLGPGDEPTRSLRRLDAGDQRRILRGCLRLQQRRRDDRMADRSAQLWGHRRHDLQLARGYHHRCVLAMAFYVLRWLPALRGSGDQHLLRPDPSRRQLPGLRQLGARGVRHPAVARQRPWA
jgi:hypothetical protein